MRARLALDGPRPVREDEDCSEPRRSKRRGLRGCRRWRLQRMASLGSHVYTYRPRGRTERKTRLDGAITA